MQYYMISTGHTLRNLYVYTNTYMHIVTVKIEAMDLKESREGHTGEFGGRKGNREM